MERRKKILAILDSDEFYGRERANIAVYKMLQEYADLRVVLNNNANEEYREHVKGLNTVYYTFPYGKMGRIKRLLLALIVNIRVLFLIARYNPDYLFVNHGLTVMTLYFPLIILRKKIVFRAGDDVRSRSSKFRVYKWEKFVSKYCYSFVSISRYVQKCVEKSGRVLLGQTEEAWSEKWMKVFDL